MRRAANWSLEHDEHSHPRRVSIRSDVAVLKSKTTVAAVPTLLTCGEVAVALRTSRAAIYAMLERAQLPGVVRIGRRVLIREEALVDFIRQRSTPSSEG
jgi:excisionase family DNA binding protein